ncbi:hypothetical protein IED13_10650 [Bosea sp. SSUT16]|jgi:hypothetical protein|uniref:Uncharacterized protein n=1 Tax=Bosea spartocytisi TaxID=2773451 RepID=A0A927E8X8_9HYPH|nr:hypothetical protein [Bosea spartocytisi]MBD3846157.1 hypothetical protein [Bosea spartocytisi]MCT4473341.1 hypothetical protein [Bosea spartocytisi]
MAKTDSRKSRQERQIVGISLDPETAKAVKAEAERRGVTVKRLFMEAWALYQKHPPK